jgi:hypothetical protein
MAAMDQVFTKNGSEIFFANRLDSRLSFETACKFRFFAQVIFNPMGSAGEGAGRKNRTDFDLSGKSVCKAQSGHVA